MTRADYYELLHRLSQDIVNAVSSQQYDHAVGKMNALITAMEIANLIPKKGRAVA